MPGPDAAISLARMAPALPVKQALLDNGLRVLVLEDHAIPSVALSLVYRVGSRNEGPGTTGLAHFFEHMMFNGSETYGPGAFDRLMEARGASNNAYTTRDITVYQDWFPPEALPLILDLEADRLRALSFAPALVESERGVVANERRRYMSEPDSRLDEQLYATAFTAHPYRWPVLGWMADIENWTLDDLKSFHARHYNPGNATLVIVGDLRAEQVFREVEDRFGSIPAGPPPRRIHTVEPIQRGERNAFVAQRAELAQVQMGWHIPSTLHDDFWALNTLEKLLFQGQSSIVYRRLVEDDELALDISGGVDSHALDPTLFTVRAHLREGIEPERFTDAYDAVLAGLIEGGIDEQRLIKAKNQLRAELVRSLKTINGKADLITAFEVFGGGHALIAEALDSYLAVDADDILRVAAAYFGRDNRSTVTLIHDRETSAPFLLPSPPPTAKKPPPPLPEPSQNGEQAGAFTFPEDERLVLANGLTLRFLEKRGAPVVCMALALEAGGLHAPPGKEGLAPLLARMLRKGTERWSEEGLAEAVDFAGGFLGMGVSKFPLSIVVEFLSEHSELALDVLEEVALKPRFPEKAFKKMKRRTRDGLRQDRSAARSVVDRYFIGALFDGHPYAAPSSGDEWSVAAIDLKDIIDFHARLFTPKNATLVVVGDFDRAAVKRGIEARFGAWSGAGTRLVFEPPKAVEHSRVLLVEKPDADEVVFQFGRLGIPRVHPDYPLVSLLNALLGGRFTSRLNTALRIEQGLTYGVSSGFLDVRAHGVFRVESFSSADTIEQAVDLALATCRRFHEEGIDAEELASTKAYLKGQFPTDVETPEQLAEWLLFFESRGLDRRYVEESFARIDALSLDQARALIREHFALDAVQMVLIGDPKALGFAEKYGETRRIPLARSRFRAPYEAP